jgi:DNA-directed RNA polymerase III subunit RPC3
MSRLASQGSKGTTSTATRESATDSACLESTACAQALHGLVTSSYLKPSTILSHISPQDKRILYEAEEKAKIAGFPTAKELRQAREVAINRLKREEEEAEKVGLVRRSSYAGVCCCN